MMTEYVVLGCVLVIMGAVQMWLRWGSWAKEQQQEDQALAKRQAEAARRVDGDTARSQGAQDYADGDAGEQSPEPEAKRSAQSTAAGARLWNRWTAILGPLGIALGLFLALWGILAG